MGDQIGSLLAGHRADLIQVSLDDMHFVPAYDDIVSQLVYVGDEQDVTSVIVDGKVIMRDKQILTIDAERVRREANELAAQIRAWLAESSD